MQVVNQHTVQGKHFSIQMDEAFVYPFSSECLN